MSLFIERHKQKFSGKEYKSVAALVVFFCIFYLGWCQIPQLSANTKFAALHKVKTQLFLTIPDCFTVIVINIVKFTL
jgi:hypothetical protein